MCAKSTFVNKFCTMQTLIKKKIRDIKNSCHEWNLASHPFETELGYWGNDCLASLEIEHTFETLG